jgi:hypothetical protein
MFLQHMHAYCKQSGEWSHSLDACWKVAQQCGMQMEPNDFKAVLTILMSDREQKILVRKHKEKTKKSGAKDASAEVPILTVASACLCVRLLGQAERT